MDKQIKVLFLAANPTDTTRLRLDEEVRAIDQALRNSRYRDKFDLQQHWAVRVSDLQGLFLRHEPDIVHFSGHGSHLGEIFLEDNYGKGQPVSSAALSTLFSLLKDNIKCVILNACFSAPQAMLIAKYIDYVIGMSNDISDKAAIKFASSFYQAIGFGRDTETAFALGCLEIDLHNLDDSNKPQLVTSKQIVKTSGTQSLDGREMKLEKIIQNVLAIFEFEGSEFAEHCISILMMAYRDGHIMLHPASYSIKMRAGQTLAKLGALQVVDERLGRTWSKYQITSLGISVLHDRKQI